MIKLSPAGPLSEPKNPEVVLGTPTPTKTSSFNIICEGKEHNTYIWGIEVRKDHFFITRVYHKIK